MSASSLPLVGSVDTGARAAGDASISDRRSPSWGAWIRESSNRGGSQNRACRSPSWGAWIRDQPLYGAAAGRCGRSPSWGAWIRDSPFPASSPRSCSRSPSWGAWIRDTQWENPYFTVDPVAPPRGERGYGNLRHDRRQPPCLRRSPSWGAWIRDLLRRFRHRHPCVAPPRGERGYGKVSAGARKYANHVAPPRGERGYGISAPSISLEGKRSLPLVGSVDTGAPLTTPLTVVGLVAPPRGERGYGYVALRVRNAVAPPRGERGLNTRPRRTTALP